MPTSETKHEETSKNAAFLSPTASASASLVIYNKIVVHVHLNSKGEEKTGEKGQKETKQPS